MNSKLAITIITIAILAIAAIGIGYAYTASTTNSGNVVSTEFVELKQANVGDNLTGAYQFVPNGFNIYYDSENINATTTKYTITNEKVGLDTDATAGDDYTAIQLGNPFKITATQTGGTPAQMDCRFDTTAFNQTTGWTFIIKFQGETGTPVYAIGSDGTWSTDTFPIKTKTTGTTTTYEETTVTVYYAYAGTATYTEAEPNAQPLGNGATGATIKFTVEKGLAITEVDANNVATINRTMANFGELVTITVDDNKTATISVVKTGDATTTVEVTTSGQVTSFVMPNYAVTVTITDTTA